MEYRFELRLGGTTVCADRGVFSDSEAVIEKAVEMAVRNGLPDSKVWVISDGGVEMILGIRSALTMRRRRRTHA